MRAFLILLFVVYSTTTYAQPKRLLLLGDSLSAAYNMQEQQGWVYLTQQWLDTQQLPLTIINASISGETSAGGLARLPALLEQHQPDYVLIELGGNDGLRGFAVAQLEQNLTQLIKLSQATGAKVLLMQIRIPPNLGPRYTRQFESLYPALAERYQLSLWPFFMEQIALNEDLMLPDGIHPNREAQPLIKQQMKRWFAQLVDD
ncbi:arylesterase [Alkalimonas amylolytica]|uniref:Acyl-CoA thioesterase-1 n=1 Tax=Alkalimonas amylolytica TaxID=152573 RepID=A0A1H4CB35_ALKAM|nr:arylesterase [Alkalimonas amylolytica]SEA57558.1 acyl-CoA thioesterase-1 [Alkalimonas amylolytica]